MFPESKFAEIALLKLALALLLVLGGSPRTEHASADQFQVNLLSGSIITIDTTDQSINWTDVLNDGTMKQRTVQLSRIKELVLSNSPASKQVARIRTYLAQLASPDYLQRNDAEIQLAKPEIGGRFLSIIKAEAEHPTMEVRYRVQRILDELEDSESDVVNEFDVLTLKDGKTFSGDAGSFRLDATFRGQPTSLSREELKLIAVPNSQPQEAAKNDTVEVQLFQQHEKEFYRKSQTIIDFEVAPAGGELARNTDVSNLFIPYGVILGTEKAGHVGISGFGFKYPKLPPKNNSVCVFETVGGYAKRFKGVLEMRFCLPNQRSVAAGVLELGVFIARVNHSRDFIMEAYNSDGQILGSVEASDQDCVFVGIKSTEPIAFVRILANPYLYRTSRKIDEDFAIDSLCFSEPITIVNPSNPSEEAGCEIVRLTNGDLLKGKISKVSSDNLSIDVSAINRNVVVPLDEVKTIRFDNALVPTEPGKRDWLMMLEDRSVLKAKIADELQSQTFEHLTFKPGEVLSYWFEKNKVRFPVKGDFGNGDGGNGGGKAVLVFPTCRIGVSNPQFKDGKMTWGQATKLEQNIDLNKTDDDPESGDDPTPKIDAIEFSESSSENIPTVWMKPPSGKPSNKGMVRLTDGQQLILGGSTGFQISKLDDQSITIEVDGRTKQIPKSNILSIDFSISK